VSELAILAGLVAVVVWLIRGGIATLVVGLVVITLAVPVAGVLMVFSFLVVPAVIAFLFTRDMQRLAYISWGSGALASVLGLWLSLAGDLPTGPLIVCMYGLVLVGAIVLRKLMPARA
jgi:zinc/manganese transport system permease protein